MKKIHIVTAILLLFTYSASIANQKAPDFNLGKNASGETITLASLKGKTVYLDFWASWCIPCKDSFPWMNRMQSTYRDQGLVILAVNLDEDKAAAENFLKKVPGLFNIIYDPQGNIATKYQVEVMPTSFLIDKNGNLVKRKLGFKLKDRGAMEADIKKALEVKKL